MSHDRALAVCFLLGKPVRANTVFPEVFGRLSATGCHVSVHVPLVGTALPDDARQADLVVQRGLDHRVLQQVREIEVAGLRCSNPVRSTKVLGNRTRTIDLLVSHGLPVPKTVQLASWSSVERCSANRPVVVKAVDARVGRGGQVLIAPDGLLPAQAPFDGPFIVQDLVDGGAVVYKLYVSGPHVQGLLKPAGTQEHTPGGGAVFEVDEDLSMLVVRAGTALGLDIYGVDVLYGPEGPTIVDVNPFPGFRGVPGAAQAISDHLGSLAWSARDACGIA